MGVEITRKIGVAVTFKIIGRGNDNTPIRGEPPRHE